MHFWDPFEAKFAYLTELAAPGGQILHTLQCARSLGFTMPRRGAFRRPFRGQFCVPYSARGSRGANLRNIRSFLALASPGHFLGFEQPFPGECPSTQKYREICSFLALARRPFSRPWGALPGGCPSTQKYREICNFLALARPGHFRGLEQPFPRGCSSTQKYSEI